MPNIAKLKLILSEADKSKLELVDGAMRLYNNSRFFNSKERFDSADIGVDLSTDFLEKATSIHNKCVRKKEAHYFLIPDSYVVGRKLVTEFGSFLIEESNLEINEDCLLYLQREAQKGCSSAFNLIVMY